MGETATKFDLLWQCYLSGQIDERRWQELLNEEPGLREYVARQASSK